MTARWYVRAQLRRKRTSSQKEAEVARPTPLDVRDPDDASIFDETRLTRSALLRVGVGAGAALALGPGLAGSAAAADLVGSGVAGTINFFSWQGYDLPIPAMKAWRKRNHVTLHSSYVSTHADIQAKFTTGGGKGLYNLSTYDCGYGPDYTKLGITSPLDLSKIPNFKHVYPLFRSGSFWTRFWHFKGQTWGIPWTWGIEGITYNAAKGKALKSYRQLLEPEFKGKLSIVDDPEAAVWIGAHILGVFNIGSKFTARQLKDIIDLWRKFKKNARSIAPSYGDVADQLVAGEAIYAVPGWAAVNSFAAGKGLKTVKTNLPKEGGASFCDSWFIPPDAKDTDTVYAWIDYSLTPLVQAQQADYLVAGTVTPASVRLMKSATRALYPYANIPRLFKKAPLPAIPLFSPGKGYTRLSDWHDAWEAFKAS
jgi:spermidine/putrescine-binding protein